MCISWGLWSTDKVELHYTTHAHLPLKTFRWYCRSHSLMKSRSTRLRHLVIHSSICPFSEGLYSSCFSSAGAPTALWWKVISKFKSFVDVSLYKCTQQYGALACVKCKVISPFWDFVKAIFNAISLYGKSPADDMVQVAHPFSLHLKPFTSAMFSEDFPLVSLCSNHRRNFVVDYFCLHFQIISLSGFNTILQVVQLLYSFSCYGTL